VTLGGNAVTLYPLYHPAAALYTRSMLGVLEQDFARIPELLGAEAREPEPWVPAEVEPEPEERVPQHAVQLGLF
jgi:uracil-DNA glycosylase